MDIDLQIKYSRALQEVQRERNALKAENKQLKQQLVFVKSANTKALSEIIATHSLSKLLDESEVTVHEQQEEIAKLKQQLAGLHQEKIEYTDTINFVETSEPDRVAKELDRLNQQLAEKEKELAKWVSSHFESKTNKPVLTTTQIINQDKIEFAVEQLEKVKEDICKISKAEIKTLKNGYSTLYIDRPEVIIKIDNQIKQLKEGK